jgi:energy-coupling factor transporter ATP-binding protein EcfA2
MTAQFKPLRIKRLTLTDFRAFPGPTPAHFDLDGKNLLIYGENGAGKSSVFHALAGFFSLKPARPLREHKNVFSGEADTSCKVSVEFTDGKAAVDWSVSRHPGSIGSKSADLRVTEAALRRACLDYRSLLDTNYRHGLGTINLFDTAVEHLLRDYSVVSGGQATTIGELWAKVLRSMPSKHTSAAITRINQACLEFNTAFRDAIPVLVPHIQAMLRALGWHDVEIRGINPSGGLTYNNARLRKDRAIEGQVLTPELTFRNHPLPTPQIFLNEARLSALGLAIYLAGRLVCTPSAPSTALKLLVLDDVLIGLDLANRLPLLDVIQKNFVNDGWQVVLLTFDRAWYEIARQRLSHCGWRHYEIFTSRVGDYEIPLLLPDEDHLYRAMAYLEGGQVKAAAVHVRTAFELALKAGCQQFGLGVKFNPDPRKVPASDFWAALKSAEYDVVPSPQCATNSKGKVVWWQPKPTKHRVVPTDLERRIEHAVSWVLNPLSHSQTVDRYRTEIEDAIYAVDELTTSISEAMALRSVQPVILMQMLSSLLKARIAFLQASITP